MQTQRSLVVSARRTFLMLSSEVAQGLELRLGLGSGLGLGFLGCRQKGAKAHDEADFVEHGPFVCFSLFAVRSGMLAIYTKGELERREGGRDSIRVRARWQKQILVFGMHKKCANKA